MKNAWKFSELEYVSPDFEAIQEQLIKYGEQIKNATNYEEYKSLILTHDQLTKETDFQCTIAFIRMYLDCTDMYYQSEMAKVQEGSIRLDQAMVNNAIIESPFAMQLREEFGDELMEGLHKDNKINGKGKELQVKVEGFVNQYQQLKASFKIEFEGKLYSEAELNKLSEDPDRERRKQSKIAYYQALLEYQEQWTNLLEELVQTRLAVAQANGYESYLDYMNEEKGRRGYGEKELNAFMGQVKMELVPVLRKLKVAQAKRIGVDQLNVYDQALMFNDGNEKHIGEAGIMKAAENMYDGLSQQAGDFFKELVERELIDMKASPNKIADMGFCTILPTLKVPYVFGNCNNTPWDVSVLTHEIGHAYQEYLSMHKQPLSMYYTQVNDIAEIPSKTMEQFSYDYAQEFFGETKDKYIFHHQQGVLDEICAYCASNEFENYLYSHPEASMRERIQHFNRIFEEYAQIEGDDPLKTYFDEGCLLFRHMGVYMFPKYLISYALSAISACEFRTKMDQDKKKAWADYVSFCEAGGSLSYRELLDLANLTVPFEEGAVKRCTQSVVSAVLQACDNL